MGRFLITTADERSWKLDRPVLFLGDWCRRYDRKEIWSGMDAVLAKPYGLMPGQKLRDSKYSKALAGKILVELAEMLNAFHLTTHSERYWKIVLGHWLERYVAVVFNRYHTLEQALRGHEISGTTILESIEHSLAKNDSSAFAWACNNDIWNHVLYAEILNFLGGVKVEPNFSPLKGISSFSQEKNLKAVRGSNFKRFMLTLANSIPPKFSRKRDAFIINSYLPLIEEVKLQLSLGQFPQLWRSPALKNMEYDPEIRRRFNVDAGCHTGFERFVRLQLRSMIPICYLEGYSLLVQQAQSLPWPTDPQFIFTSNSFDMDEVFKVWCGSRVEEGAPYFIGQHGNNYGTSVYDENCLEQVISDKFFTWGWSDGRPNVVPAFCFKVANRKPGKFDPAGGLLLIEVNCPNFFTPWDSYSEFGIYQEEQFRFAESLSAMIQEKLVVRLHGSHKDLQWFDECRWRDRSPHIKIEAGNAPVRQLIAQSRLVVHSYDSTGILETLALNIPTLCFWQGGLDHLLPRAKPYYELLRNAGILADTPEQAAKMIASHWDNIGKWWGSKKVQDARKAFCNQYARVEKTPVRTLKRLLVNR